MTELTIPTAAELLDHLRNRLAAAEDLASSITWLSAKKGSTKSNGAGEWTNVLLNMVLELGRTRGFSVYPQRYYFSRASRGGNTKHDRPARPDDRGEFLVDAAWTNYPDTKDWVTELVEGRARRRGIVLACESEWAASRFGKQPPLDHIAAILDDFAKLTELRAPLKVLFFAYFNDGDLATFEHMLTVHRRAATPIQPGESYLCCGWPWDAT